MCLFVWTIIYVISLLGLQTLERDARQLIWLSIAFIILFIAYYGMRAPNLFRIKSLRLSQKHSQSKLTKADLDQLKVELETIMVSKRPYLNRKFLKAELAEMLGINNPELARLLYERIGMNFFGLVQEVGFNSKTTFNKAFKNLIGLSPSEYFSQAQDINIR